MQEQNLPKPATTESNVTPAPEFQQQEGGHEQVPSIATTPETVVAHGDSVNQAGPVPQYAPVNLPQPIVASPAEPAADSNDSNRTAPTVADDVDVIEKVWVEKAKSIVKQTRDDPYTQEKEVSNLQEDYQQKRYGKDKLNG